jgi:hypothetical protein
VADPQVALAPKPSTGRALAGLIKVFHSPESLFPEVGKTVTWVVPFIACMLVTLISVAVVINVIGLERITRTQLESNPRMVDQLGQDKIDEIAQQADTPVRKAITYIGAPVATGVTLLIVAGILAGLLAMSSASAPYRNILTVCAYSFFALGIVSLIAMAIALASLDSYDGVDPGRLVSLSPALFLGESSSKVLHSVLSSLDLLSFWCIFLIGLGLSKISPRLKLSKAIVLVLIPWAVYVAGKAGLAALF